MNAADWRDMKELALDTIREVYGSETVEDHIVALARDGMPKAKIGNLLGVSESQVWTVLRERKQDPAQ
jgi:hypoxanthine phosphoribosyltransferase